MHHLRYLPKFLSYYANVWRGMGTERIHSQLKSLISSTYMGSYMSQRFNRRVTNAATSAVANKTGGTKINGVEKFFNLLLLLLLLLFLL